MTRDRKLKNRFGLLGGCRSRGHAKRKAWLQFKREFFMVPRTMRRYWNDLNKPLYGPCRCMARYLQLRKTMRSPSDWR